VRCKDRETESLSAIFSQIDQPRTADSVTSQVETLILEGVLRAGDRLPAERELSRQMDVSRPVLREALKRLEKRGLIVTGRGGAQIADVTGQIFSPQIVVLIADHPKAVADYNEYRRDMEGMTAAYAAERATEEDKTLLADLVARMREAHQTEDFDREAAIDVEFHSAVGECAHNLILLHTLRACYRLLSEGIFQNRLAIYRLEGAREQLLAQHLAIYEAILRGEPSAAREAAQDHIRFVAAAMDQIARSGDWQRVSQLRLRQRTGANTIPSPSLVPT
jgi:GntR family transcriptional repressor for pyruvate dehydrogenase complex